MPTPLRLLTLPSGLTVAVERLDSSSIAAVDIRLAAGAAHDPDGREGLGWIAVETLFRGAASRSARELMDAFESDGVRWGGAIGIEQIDIEAVCRAGKLDRALALLAEVIARPDFIEEQLVRAGRLARQEIDRLADDPGARANALLTERFLGPRIGHLTAGALGSLGNIDREQVAAWWRQALDPGRIQVVIAGGIEPDAAARSVEAAFGGFSLSAGPQFEDPIPPQPAAGVFHQFDDIDTTRLAAAWPGPVRSDPRFIPMFLAIEVLGGSGASRLFTEVRERRGLAYAVQAGLFPLRRSGAIVVYAGPEAARAQETLDVIRSEIARLAVDTAPDEIDRARALAISGLRTSGELTEARAGMMTAELFLAGKVRAADKIIEDLERVTVEQVKAALRDFPPEPLVAVAVGKDAVRL
jgi:predicted Zn-dependent peptidase